MARRIGRCLSTTRQLIGLIGVVGLLTTVAAAAEPTLQKVTYYSQSLETDREYWLYLPRGYDPQADKLWPVILFLHGGGERGDQLELVLRHGPIMEVVIKRRDLPFIILAPQMPELSEEEQRRREERRRSRSPEDNQQGRRSFLRQPTGQQSEWGSLGPPEGWNELQNDLLKMVDDTLNTHRADSSRVYLTGLSYGGYGSWYMATHHPDRWAAVAPICGAGGQRPGRKDWQAACLVDPRRPRPRGVGRVGAGDRRCVGQGGWRRSSDSPRRPGTRCLDASVRGPRSL